MTKRKTVVSERRKLMLVGYFDTYVNEFKVKRDDKTNPAWPCQSDSELGNLLGIKAAAILLLGSGDETSQYFEKTINELLGRGE